MGQIKSYLQTAITGVLGLDVVIYFERPESVEKSINKFLVVDLPAGLRNKEIGGMSSGFKWTESTVRFDVFVRDRMKASSPNEPDINELDKLVDDLSKCFPIVDRTNDIVIAKPRIVVPSSSDGNGFHYSRIHAGLTTAG